MLGGYYPTENLHLGGDISAQGTFGIDFAQMETDMLSDQEIPVVPSCLKLVALSVYPQPLPGQTRPFSDATVINWCRFLSCSVSVLP